ncbi:MAG: ATP-dependent Clp protease ATP-binding subunit ClpX [Chitinophagales bacterium]|jgi:ATP-dependent Clp protease ATP-binding subunit ClpX|nr:ATP-dependent Clp protease ATP-binding subunit ClpX [Chitinophagales bacterium]
MSKKNNTVLECSFCGKKATEAAMMIGGGLSNICDECVERAHEMVIQEVKGGRPSLGKSVLSVPSLPKEVKPKDIKLYLDQYVIGQDDAKKSLAVAVYNHFKRISQPLNDEIEIEKSNLVMIGQTGTGKTLLARTVAKYLNLPFAIVDATVFTEAGYVGEDVESILTRLLQVCDYNVEQAEHGIVYIDEVDKLGRRGDNPSITKDVSGEGVQQSLLKLLEGTEVLVPPHGGRKHPEQKLIKVNTKNILFICGGAFDGIERIISARVQSRSIGYGSNDELDEQEKKNVLQFVNQHDLKKFGLIPELVGRMPVVVALDQLDIPALRMILTEPKNAIIKQYKRLFALEGIELTVAEDVLDFISEQAFENKLGARGLRSMCELLMADLMYELPSGDVTAFTLTMDYAANKLTGKILKKLKAA